MGLCCSHHAGKAFSKIEPFGQYPLQVNGYCNLSECLEGAMVEGEMEEAATPQSVKYGQEVSWARGGGVLVACCRAMQHVQLRGGLHVPALSMPQQLQEMWSSCPELCKPLGVGVCTDVLSSLTTSRSLFELEKVNVCLCCQCDKVSLFLLKPACT